MRHDELFSFFFRYMPARDAYVTPYVYLRSIERRLMPISFSFITSLPRCHTPLPCAISRFRCHADYVSLGDTR